MIISFKHKGLEAFFQTGSLAGIQPIHQNRLREVLTVLNVARGPEDLQRPSWRTHPLRGSRDGFYAIWVQANWRLTFRFIDTDVELLDYLDYH